MKVTYKDHMGSDLSVVNAARVSFGKESEWVNSGNIDDNIWPNLSLDEKQANGGVLSKGDKSLIGFLARGCSSGDWDKIINDLDEVMEFKSLKDYKKAIISDSLKYVKRMHPHWTPFGHTSISLHMKLPLFVTRQINKHQVGFVINEVSRRYVKTQPEFYNPNSWRLAADNVKQGSSDKTYSGYFEDEYNHGVDRTLEGKHGVYENYIYGATDLYNRMIDSGICPEQARMVLPQSMYTEFWMTGNLYGWANLYNQRIDPHAQKEVQEVAKQVGDIIEPLFPESWKALT